MKWFLSSLLCLFPFVAQADQIRDFWFSGAEISSFDLEQSRYEKVHPGHAELIFVTEPFLPKQQVKDERGSDTSIDVLKLNALTTFNTGLYSYRTMTSTFKPIEIAKFPTALKSSTSIQDWCGQAFQQSNFREGKWDFELRSYFQSFGDQDVSVKDAYLEDEIWLTLRLDPTKLPIGKIQIIPGAVFSRFEHLPIQSFSAIAKITPDGELSEYQINYPELGRRLTIFFDKKFPHIIRKWTDKTAKGTTTATLKKRLMNVNYWNLNQPEDAIRRRQLGLDPEAN